MSFRLCIHCEKEDQRRGRWIESQFCSEACKTAYMINKDGPVQCCECFAETDTVAEADAESWQDIEPFPEGISYNFTGLCPECWREQHAEATA